MTVWKKYLLIQIPGWVLVALFLSALHRWADIPFWAAAGLFLLYAVKDLVIYPFVRSAYESNVKTGAEQLIGTGGVASEQLNPEGYVQVNGELWKAQAAPGEKWIPQGGRIRVQAAQGLILIVTLDSGQPDTGGARRR